MSTQTQQSLTTTELAAKKKEAVKSLKWQRDKDREMVRGIFRFHEVPGGEMMMVYKAYKEDKVERYQLIDNCVYTIPLGLARHLNKNCWYPEYEYMMGDASTVAAFGGNQQMRVARKVRRCSFQSLEFVDIDDLTPNSSSIVGVETF